MAHPSSGFWDPSWSAARDRLVAYNAGGDHQTYNGYGFDTTTVPGGLYVYGDLSQTNPGTLALPPPGDGHGGYLQFFTPRFMGTDKIVFVAQGSVWSIPAACNHCSFPGDATKLYDGGSTAATQASGVVWTAATIRPASPPPPATSHLAIRTGRAAVSAGASKITLACDSGACHGSLSLVTKLRQRVHRRVHGQRRTVTVTKSVVLARGRYTVASGTAGSIVLRLSRTAQRMLAHARGHRLRVQAIATQSGRITATRVLVL